MDNAITLNHVSYFYNHDTSFSNQALFDINLAIPKNSFLAIIGHTGSGKSTLIQHLNALLKPTYGRVNVLNHTITAQTKEKKLSAVRKDIGLIFQFPETQLFEDTVAKDIAFGPKNFGLSSKEIDRVTKQCLKMVGLSEEFLNKSPFELSGGQKRKVAIAGILAIKPKIIVLDEPTVGLDPSSQKQIMNMIHTIYEKYKITIILVSHQMDIVARYADTVLVMNEGRIVKKAPPRLLFNDYEFLQKMNLGIPSAVDFATHLQDQGVHFNRLPLTEDELANTLASKIKSKTRDNYE